MAAASRLVLFGAALAGAGCSTNSLQRSAYEAVQGVHEQRCREDLTVKCAPREDYEAYRRRRDEVLEAD